MNYDRHTILELVAQRRLSPAEAEGLLLSAREDAWLIFASCWACLLLALLPQHAPLHPLLHTLHAAFSHLPASLAALDQFLAPLHRVTGGLQ